MEELLGIEVGWAGLEPFKSLRGEPSIKSQYIMNNEINEIKNTLEATNSRIMEAEVRISEWQIDGETMETVTDFVLGGAPRSLQMVTSAMK